MSFSDQSAKYNETLFALCMRVCFKISRLCALYTLIAEYALERTCRFEHILIGSQNSIEWLNCVLHEKNMGILLGNKAVSWLFIPQQHSSSSNTSIIISNSSHNHHKLLHDHFTFFKWCFICFETDWKFEKKLFSISMKKYEIFRR